MQTKMGTAWIAKIGDETFVINSKYASDLMEISSDCDACSLTTLSNGEIGYEVRTTKQMGSCFLKEIRLERVEVVNDHPDFQPTPKEAGALSPEEIAQILGGAPVDDF